MIKDFNFSPLPSSFTFRADLDRKFIRTQYRNENLTTEGVELVSLPLGAGVKIGDVLREVTQIGKECHTRCAIYYQAGDCVMPREGIFVRVLTGGRVAPGDAVRVRAWGLGGAAGGGRSWAVIPPDQGGSKAAEPASRGVSPRAHEIRWVVATGAGCACGVDRKSVV